MAQQIHLTWIADDPDGDRLIYGVYFRGEEETQWKLLRANFAENTLMLEGDVLADGKYLFRVVASDKQTNPAGAAREAELVSPPVLFDNTPPVVRASGVRDGSRVEVTVEASDVTSAIRRAEYSLDAASWMPLNATDGVADGNQERFTLALDQHCGRRASHRGARVRRIEQRRAREGPGSVATQALCADVVAVCIPSNRYRLGRSIGLSTRSADLAPDAVTPSTRPPDV